ncbi:MAG: 30S ribosomal protein S2 [Chthoniobacterales bacterium]|nr:30S ribosomal protein S2 [Chthoniobacterales bacterium]
MASIELINELLESGVHYGHQTKRWNPKMREFILEEKNDIYIIDISRTVEQLEVATKFLAGLVSAGGKVLFVGCKKQAQEAVKEAAESCGQFYVHNRWLGGTLTNLATIRKSVARLHEIEKKLKSPGVVKIGKKEQASLRREQARLGKNLDGLREMDKLPAAVIVIDTTREDIAVREANRLGIPVVAIVDTNSDPELVNYPIAGNDDAIRSIRVVLQKLVEAMKGAAGVRQKKVEPELSGIAE